MLYFIYVETSTTYSSLKIYKAPRSGAFLFVAKYNELCYTYYMKKQIKIPQLKGIVRTHIRYNKLYVLRFEYREWMIFVYKKGKKEWTLADQMCYNTMRGVNRKFENIIGSK